ncbi:hypothetical protein EF148_13235 [Stenotrophomonas maltophilia]|nr:hypothetical protein [Stenotrophomonas maltophilia]
MRPAAFACTLLLNSKGSRAMGTSKPAKDLRRVTLSVGEHVYTSEIWRISESRWVLLAVEVHGVGERSDLGIKAPSCLKVLEAGKADRL